MGRILINIALNLFPFKLYNRDGFYKFVLLVYIALAKWPPPAAQSKNMFVELPLSKEVSGKQRYIFVLGPDLVKGQ